MRVLFFAQLRDVTECESIVIPMVGAVDGAQLWAALLEKFPALASHRPSVRLARNWEYVNSDASFTETDEVALIPPVSGG